MPLSNFAPRWEARQRVREAASARTARSHPRQIGKLHLDHDCLLLGGRKPSFPPRAAVAQLVRALDCGSRGRWFDPTQLYHSSSCEPSDDGADEAGPPFGRCRRVHSTTSFRSSATELEGSSGTSRTSCAGDDRFFSRHHSGRSVAQKCCPFPSVIWVTDQDDTPPHCATSPLRSRVGDY
jgi:hypothetical protein